MRRRQQQRRRSSRQIVVADRYRPLSHKQTLVSGIGAADRKAKQPAVLAFHQQVVDGGDVEGLRDRPVGGGEAEAGAGGCELGAGVDRHHHIGQGLAAQRQAEAVAAAPFGNGRGTARFDHQ